MSNADNDDSRLLLELSTESAGVITVRYPAYARPADARRLGRVLEACLACNRGEVDAEGRTFYPAELEGRIANLLAERLRTLSHRGGACSEDAEDIAGEVMGAILAAFEPKGESDGVS